MTKQKLFMKGDVNYLSAKEAQEKYPTNELTIHRECDDGTVSVIFLQASPVQRGQAEWKQS